MTDLATSIPPELRLGRLAVERGVATVELNPRPTDREALAQIVYTLTAFPTVNESRSTAA